MKDIAIILLAAGKGTRMKSPLPKVLHPIAGWSMVRHALNAAMQLAPAKVIAVVGEGMSAVEAEVKAVCPNSECVVQKEQLGTGHAVQQALPTLSGFKGIALVMYADTPLITPATLKNLVSKIATPALTLPLEGEGSDGKKPSREGASIAVLGFEPADAGAYGRLVTEGDKLHAIVEYKDASDAERAIRLCNSGVMALDATAMPALLGAITNQNAKGEYYLTDVVGLARGQGRECTYIRCEETEVLGVNSQAERAVAEAVVQQQLRQKHMECGVMMLAPETVFFSMDTEIAGGVTLYPHVVFAPKVKVETGVEIKSFSHLEGAVIRKEAMVGPYARLRPGSDIGEECKIGNFVEVKAAKLHKGVKASHLTYIGDAEIGEESNLGAGTVTCNYDGYNKHKTLIGKEVFVGSNTSLVAPVTVGDGAIIGAGSTIIKDVEADARAINEMPQRTEPGRAKLLRGVLGKKN